MQDFDGSLISYREKRFFLEWNKDLKRDELLVEVVLNKKENLVKVITFEQYYKLNELTCKTLLGKDLNYKEEITKAIKSGIFYKNITLEALITYFKQRFENPIDIYRKMGSYLDFAKKVVNAKSVEQVSQIEKELADKAQQRKEDPLKKESKNVNNK